MQNGIAVIGYGYWGPNLVRNFLKIAEAKPLVVCDLDKEKLAAAKAKFPEIETTASFEETIKRNDIGGIAIATPPFTHYGLALMALDCGKNIMVEKPLTLTVKDAEKLVEKAKKNGKTLLSAHTWEYHPAINRIKEIIQSGELGKILFINSDRVNLGLFQPNRLNVVWDLAPHDISIINFLLDSVPENVSAIGKSNVIDGIIDDAHYSLQFENNVLANVYNSWMAPEKKREIIIVGSEKMLVYNDLAEQKIKLFEKGVKSAKKEINTTRDVEYIDNGFKAIALEQGEALEIECRHFIECAREGKKPRTCGISGLNVVKTITAIQESIKKSGERININ